MYMNHDHDFAQPWVIGHEGFGINQWVTARLWDISSSLYANAVGNTDIIGFLGRGCVVVIVVDVVVVVVTVLLFKWGLQFPIANQSPPQAVCLHFLSLISGELY